MAIQALGSSRLCYCPSEPASRPYIERPTRQSALKCNSSIAQRADSLVAESTHQADSPLEARLVSHQDGKYTVQGAINTHASLADVWQILTDYEALGEVFSNIKDSKLHTSQPEIILHQDCKWEFLIFSGGFRAELKVKEEKQKGRLAFKLIHSNFMDDFLGVWQIEEGDTGGCSVEHTLTVVPKMSPPAFMDNYTQKIFVKQVASILRDLEQELQLRASDEFRFADF